MRLDQYLTEHGGLYSRNKAQELIKAGKVRVAGSVVTKSSHKVAEGDAVEVEETDRYVSRAAQKLKGFLPYLPFSPEGMRGLDIGSSTGGFTQVLLEAGAVQVDAVDVGRDQLHPELRADARVHSFESTDIRDFEPGRRYDVVVSDVSFISLLHILDDVERLAERWIVLLFKPQYEVGREAKRDRNGVLRDDKAVMKAMLGFEDACAVKGWRLVAKETSKLLGKEGNIEYCYCFERG
jgi:23S rRNA (cytidine1920-2'-O)/16S rRNA (cytidine1409-2'-O)-methyltransferase